MDLLSGLSSILGGSITGLVGTALSSVYEYKTRKLDIELAKTKLQNEIELKKVDLELLKAESEAKIEIASVTAAGAVEVEDSKAFRAAIESEPKKYAEGPLTHAQNWLMVALDFLRGVIRPSLTLYLVIITTIMYFNMKTAADSLLPPDAVGIINRIVDMVLFLTSTVVTWWFGTRTKDKKKQ